MALQLWETFKESITTYTGLSPATFFTVVALGLAVYYLVSTMFGSDEHGHHSRPREFEEQMEPLPPPVQLGEVTEEVLKEYDGSDPKKPLLMAIKGQIYDVSQSRYVFSILVSLKFRLADFDFEFFFLVVIFHFLLIHFEGFDQLLGVFVQLFFRL